MQVIEAIRTRQSVKQFDPNYDISEAEINELLSLSILSPTAFNIQHCRYLIVRDKELRQKLRSAAWNQSQVTDASLLTILCADLKAWEKSPERYFKDSTEDRRKKVVETIQNFYNGKEQVQRDEGIRSCSLAATTLMLAAKSMGYDSCPMDGFDFDQVAKLINLPADHIIVMFVAIGKPLQEARSRISRLPLKDQIILNRF